jgi:hypothetical protein
MRTFHICTPAISLGFGRIRDPIHQLTSDAEEVVNVARW